MLLAVFITFGLIMLADKYRYRPPSLHARRSLSKQSATIERANPGRKNKTKCQSPSL